MLRRSAVLLVLALLVVPTFAFADSFQFTADGNGGTWDWIGSNPLNATFNEVRVAFNGGPTTLLTGSVMTITTGAYNAGLSNPGLGLFIFDPGGSIVISGGSTCAGDCFSGVFSALQLLIPGGGGTALLTGAFVSGTVAPEIAALFAGSVGGSVEGSIALSLQGDILTCEECRGLSGSGDMAVTPVPEPASLALLGTGLLGLASRFRKKLSA
jgi:hypothetical protein